MATDLDQRAATTTPGRRRAPSPAALGGTLLALLVVALLAPFAGADPPGGLTGSNAPWTDEGFNLANARNRVVFGRFDTDDVDRSLSNGAFSGVAALVFAVAGPSVEAGRSISVLAAAAAVLLLAVGLARPLGPRAALLAAAALGGCQLLLQYGRLALVEPLLVLLLVGALVLMARAPARPSVGAGAAAGALLALAVSVKAIAVVPGAVLLGVPLLLALVRRDRAAARMPLAGCASFVVLVGAWFLLVGLPNLDRLGVALRIWPTVDYPTDPVALVTRLGDYLTGSDGALPRAAPLLVAAAAGLAVLAARWRSLPPDRRDLVVVGALWGIGAWAAIAVGDYAPNRYIVPALPGLAVVAGFGLDALARRLTAAMARGGGRAGVATAVTAALLLAVAVPGALAHVRAAAGAAGRGQLDAGRAALTAAAGPGAVVFGSYGPTMLLETDARLVTPWPPAGANTDRVRERFGVTHVLSDGTDQAATRAVSGDLARDAEPVAQIPWGPHTLTLYRLRPATAD